MPAILLTLALLWLPLSAGAQSAQALIDAAVTEHVLPRHAALTEATGALAATARDHCEAEDPALRAAFGVAFDAWIGVSHLTFGPAEDRNRLFALAFWPDARSVTPRTLARLIETRDPVVDRPGAYAEVSIAARGFYALEFLLYDPALRAQGDPAYHCALIRAVAADLDATARDLRADWEDRFADLMRGAGTNDRIQSPQEALRLLFGALDHGLEFTADLRLGRPMGSPERARPELAEARRSARSQRHVVLSLEALAELTDLLARDVPDLQADLARRFASTLEAARTLDDPVFAGVATPQGRLRLEALQQRVQDIRDRLRASLGPALGVAAGFNALDGD
ncbi:MAG: imelysin family protein [Pararhodobacter sp.]